MKYVVLDNVRSAFNVGSIFRTCDGAGIDKLFLCGMTCHPPHQKLSKTALQADSTVNWEYKEDTLSLIKELKLQDILIISAENIPKAVDLFKVEKIKNDVDTALVVGHELIGVGEDIIKLSDIVVKIPMYGKKSSLNVGVSAGILIYNLFRSL